MREHLTRRRIEFADTDLAGIVHFSRFFVFMETAEDEFLRALGWTFTRGPAGERLGWPKVAASCEYRSPARYGDLLEIRLRVARRSSRTITYEFEFRREGREIALGRTVSVCCEPGEDGSLRAVEVPRALLARLGAAGEGDV